MLPSDSSFLQALKPGRSAEALFAAKTGGALSFSDRQRELMILLVSETKTYVSRIVGRVEFDDLSRMHNGVTVSASPIELPGNVCDGGQRHLLAEW